ncbi:dTMP kinase [Alphaproteobacteria bacterium]|nr:dTMP kinase [Alphaproteobacteria bacterium]
MFITFEGGEGSGKSTQMNFLSKFLTEQNIDHITTREPGGTEIGEQIRKILVQGKIDKLDSYSEFLCFTASRRELLKKIILPALSNNKIVLCDRFLDSSLVYQGLVGGLDEEIILKVHDNFCFKKYPDLTLLLNVNYKTGLARKNKTKLVENRFENFKEEFHELVQQKFLELARKYDDRCRIINADNDKDFIFNEVIDQIKHFFSVTL